MAFYRRSLLVLASLAWLPWLAAADDPPPVPESEGEVTAPIGTVPLGLPPSEPTVKAGFAPAGERWINPDRDGILDDAGNPIDLSRYTNAQRIQIVDGFFAPADPAKRERNARRYLEWLASKGAMSEHVRRQLFDPDSACSFGPAVAPKGMTSGRARQLQVANPHLPPRELFELIMSQPPREPAAGEEPAPPFTLVVPSPDGPNCPHAGQ